MQFKRRLIILLTAALIVSGISLLLNRASFDSHFMVDAVSGATRLSDAASSEEMEEAAMWGYSVQDIALPDKTAYMEETADIGNVRYVVLQRKELPKGTLRILSDTDISGYAAAVRKVAAYYEDLGFSVEVRECGTAMMLSLAHAERFDLFLLREEAVS